jgi:hypothetical protein
MVQNIGDWINNLVPQGSTVGLIALILIIGLVVVIVFGFIALLIWNKKRWNLRIEIKLPRSDGKIINGEWGRGFFHSKRGVVYIKRPGFMQPKIPLKIFDPKRYLQGSDLMTVIQLSPVDYKPVLPDSFLEVDVNYQDDETGKIYKVKESVLNIECDTGHDKAWQVAFETAAKRAYTLQSFFQQFQTPITIAIVLVAVFVGIAALWSQLPG